MRNLNIPKTQELPSVESTASRKGVPDLQEFIDLARGGFARKDRFVVSFNIPEIMHGFEETARELMMLCESATMPGKLITTKTLRINTINEYRASTTDYLGSSIIFSFYVPIYWDVRMFFEQWMSQITGNELDRFNGAAPPSNRAVAFYDDYISRITISALNPNPTIDRPDVPSYVLQLNEAWPISLHSQTFSYSNTEIQRLSVECVYKWWDHLYVDPTLDAPDEKILKKTTHQPNINLHRIPQSIQDIQHGILPLRDIISHVLPSTPFGIGSIIGL